MLPVPQHGIMLAVHIISTDFGQLKVCECLLRRGTLKKVAIAGDTKLPVDKVTKCLWVLIQHNCVQPFALCEEGDFGESEKVSTQYMALFDNIFYRLRFPKFLSVVSRQLDEKCASLLEGLLQHGRLTLSQMVDRATSYSYEGGNARERFMKLVGARFVERCPAAEPLVSPSTQEEARAKKKGAKSNKIAQSEVTLEGCVISAATLMEAERFSVITDTGMDITEENRSNGSYSIKVGKKRKHNLSELDGDLDILGCNKEPIWRLNFEEFKRLFRNKACVESARTRLNDGAGIVLSAILEATKTMQNTASLSLDAIFGEVIKSEEGRTLTSEHVRAFLVQLGCNSADPDELYTFDLTEIIKHARQEEVESIVLKRYENGAYRLFRFLAEHHRPIEINGISGKTLVEQKDTNDILHKLWKGNFLHKEKLFYSVDKNINDHILDELYHAALNLRIRVAYEMDRGREVLMLDREKQVGEAGKRYQKLKKVKLLLDSSLAKLDDAIILFHDF